MTTGGWTDNAKRGQKRRVIALSLFSSLFGLAQPALADRVTGIEVAADRVTIHCDGPLDRAQTFVLPSPARVAIDLPGVRPAPIAAVPDADGRLIATVRQGRVEAGTTRVVLDLAEPALVSRGRFSADGMTFTLDLRPADDGALQVAARAGRQSWEAPAAGMGRARRSRYSLTVPLDAVETGPPRARISGRADRPLVVIDAGHGGHDPGAIGVNGLREKDITLAVARGIRDELLRGGRVRVALTREDDRFLVLGERAQIARALKADLFISIHADSAPTPDASGATVYTLSEVASDRTAARLATRENKADIINGINLAGQNADVSSILIDLAQRETMNASARFASVLRREAADRVPFKGDYHRMAGFAVLKAPDTPAILLEVGYVTNPVDVARLTSADGQQAIAESIRRAVDVQLARRLAAR